MDTNNKADTNIVRVEEKKLRNESLQETREEALNRVLERLRAKYTKAPKQYPYSRYR